MHIECSSDDVSCVVMRFRPAWYQAVVSGVSFAAGCVVMRKPILSGAAEVRIAVVARSGAVEMDIGRISLFGINVDLFGVLRKVIGDTLVRAFNGFGNILSAKKENGNVLLWVKGWRVRSVTLATASVNVEVEGEPDGSEGVQA